MRVLVMTAFFAAGVSAAQPAITFSASAKRTNNAGGEPEDFWKIQVASTINQPQTLHAQSVDDCTLTWPENTLLKAGASLILTATGASCTDKEVTLWSDFTVAGSVAGFGSAVTVTLPALSPVDGVEKRELTVYSAPFVRWRKSQYGVAGNPCTPISDPPDAMLYANDLQNSLKVYNDPAMALKPCLVGNFRPTTYSGKLGETALTVNVKDHWLWPAALLALSALAAWTISRWRTVLLPLAVARRDLGDFGPVLAKLQDNFDETAYAIRDGFRQDLQTLYDAVALAEHSATLAPETLEGFKKQAKVLHGVPKAWDEIRKLRTDLQTSLNALTSLPAQVTPGWRLTVGQLLRGRTFRVTDLTSIATHLKIAQQASDVLTQLNYAQVNQEYQNWRTTPPTTAAPFQDRLGELGDALAGLEGLLARGPLDDTGTYLEKVKTSAGDVYNRIGEVKKALPPRPGRAAHAAAAPALTIPNPVTEQPITSNYQKARFRVMGWSVVLLGLGTILSVIAGLKSEYFSKATFGTPWDYLTLIAYGLGIQAITEVVFAAVNSLKTGGTQR